MTAKLDKLDVYTPLLLYKRVSELGWKELSTLFGWPVFKVRQHALMAAIPKLSDRKIMDVKTGGSIPVRSWKDSLQYIADHGVLDMKGGEERFDMPVSPKKALVDSRVDNPPAATKNRRGPKGPTKFVDRDRARHQSSTYFYQDQLDMVEELKARGTGALLSELVRAGLDMVIEKLDNTLPALGKVPANPADRVRSDYTPFKVQGYSWPVSPEYHGSGGKSRKTKMPRKSVMLEVVKEPSSTKAVVPLQDQTWSERAYAFDWDLALSIPPDEMGDMLTEAGFHLHSSPAGMIPLDGSPNINTKQVRTGASGLDALLDQAEALEDVEELTEPTIEAGPIMDLSFSDSEMASVQEVLGKVSPDEVEAYKAEMLARARQVNGE